VAPSSARRSTPALSTRSRCRSYPSCSDRASPYSQERTAAPQRSCRHERSAGAWCRAAIGSVADLRDVEPQRLAEYKTQADAQVGPKRDRALDNATGLSPKVSSPGAPSRSHSVTGGRQGFSPPPNELLLLAMTTPLRPVQALAMSLTQGLPSAEPEQACGPIDPISMSLRGFDGRG
jgi:hypothetical protein